MIRLVLALLLIAMAAPCSGQVRVRGYFKKDGTYVAPHYRSSPNDSRTDNYSSHGNINPYTGKVGTVDPYAPRSDNSGLRGVPVAPLAGYVRAVQPALNAARPPKPGYRALRVSDLQRMEAERAHLAADLASGLRNPKSLSDYELSLLGDRDSVQVASWEEPRTSMSPDEAADAAEAVAAADEAAADAAQAAADAAVQAADTAASSRWIHVGTTEENVREADRETISISGQRLTVWLRESYFKPQSYGGMPGVSVVLSQHEYDCSDRTYRIRNVLLRDKTGRVLDSVESAYPSANAIAPETMGEHTLNVLCSIRDARSD